MAVSGKVILLKNDQALRAQDSAGAAVSLFKLDASSKLQLLKLPQVSVDPSEANDLARKSFIDAQFLIRDDRLEVVEQDVATLEGQMAVVQGDDATSGSIAKAKKDAQDYVDQKISELVNGAPQLLDTLQELAAAIGNDPSIATSIANSIGLLDQRLDVLESDELTSGSVANAIKAERDRAEAIEDDLDTRLDVAESDILAIETQLASLASNSAIIDLTGRMTTAEQEIDALQSDMLLKASQADLDNLDGYAQDIRSDVDSVQSEVDLLNGPSSMAGSVDQKIASAISAVVDSAPEAFDTLKEIADYISSDQSAASAMTAQLGDHESRLDVLEPKVATLESEMDQVQSDLATKASQSALSSEQSAREAADAALDVRLDAVEALKKDVLTYESFTIDSSQLAAITVQHPIKGMPFVIREGILGRPGKDFTFSGAVISFAGEWVNPSGLSSVEVGTELDVAYMYEMDAFSSGSGGGGGGGGGSGPAVMTGLASTMPLNSETLVANVTNLGSEYQVRLYDYAVNTFPSASGSLRFEASTGNIYVTISDAAYASQNVIINVFAWGDYLNHYVTVEGSGGGGGGGGGITPFTLVLDSGTDLNAIEEATSTYGLAQIVNGSGNFSVSADAWGISPGIGEFPINGSMTPKAVFADTFDIMLADLPMPFTVTVTDLDTGRTQTISGQIVASSYSYPSFNSMSIFDVTANSPKADGQDLVNTHQIAITISDVNVNALNEFNQYAFLYKGEWQFQHVQTFGPNPERYVVTLEGDLAGIVPFQGALAKDGNIVFTGPQVALNLVTE